MNENATLDVVMGGSRATIAEWGTRPPSPRALRVIAAHNDTMRVLAATPGLTSAERTAVVHESVAVVVDALRGLGDAAFADSTPAPTDPSTGDRPE